MIRYFALLFSLLITSSVIKPDAFAQQSDNMCSSTTHRAFDFWLGQWNVTAKGKFAGRNTIVKTQGGCLIREDWVSASPGYTGTSYNFYNSIAKQWQQLWIDNQGGFLELIGRSEGGKMVLESKPTTQPDGSSFVNRITWTPNQDGSVRQLWERIGDNNKSRIIFDGHYEKVSNSTD